MTRKTIDQSRQRSTSRTSIHTCARTRDQYDLRPTRLVKVWKLSMVCRDRHQIVLFEKNEVIEDVHQYPNRQFRYPMSCKLHHLFKKRNHNTVKAKLKTPRFFFRIIFRSPPPFPYPHPFSISVPPHTYTKNKIGYPQPHSHPHIRPHFNRVPSTCHGIQNYVHTSV